MLRKNNHYVKMTLWIEKSQKKMLLKNAKPKGAASASQQVRDALDECELLNKKI